MRGDAQAERAASAHAAQTEELRRQLEGAAHEAQEWRGQLAQAEEAAEAAAARAREQAAALDAATKVPCVADVPQWLDLLSTKHKDF